MLAQKNIVMNAKKEILRIAEPDRLVKALELSPEEKRIQGLTSVGYYFRPFSGIIAAVDGNIRARRDAHPNDFYPLSPLDYASAVERFLKGERIMPLQIFTTLTNRCNFACTLCFSRKDHEAKESRDLSAGTYLQTLEYLLSFGGPLAQNISSGASGEAIFHPEFERIMEFSGQKGVLTFLTTNGSRADQGFVDCVARNSSILTFSIHGIHEEAFRRLESPPAGITLERILHTLKSIVSRREGLGRSKDMVIGVTSLVHPDNCGHYLEFASRLVDIGVDYIHFNPVLPNLESHGIRFSEEAGRKTEGELSLLGSAFSDSGTYVRSPLKIDQNIDDAKYYYDPRGRKVLGTCLIAMLQPSIHPMYGDQDAAKMTACRFYPDVTENPDFWYTSELGPRSFESVWTRENIERIQRQSMRCHACSSERQILDLDWMLDIKRTYPEAEFHLLFPEFI